MLINDENSPSLQHEENALCLEEESVLIQNQEDTEHEIYTGSNSHKYYIHYYLRFHIYLLLLCLQYYEKYYMY